jgi:hypothetical protein
MCCTNTSNSYLLSRIQKLVNEAHEHAMVLFLFLNYYFVFFVSDLIDFLCTIPKTCSIYISLPIYWRDLIFILLHVLSMKIKSMFTTRQTNFGDFLCTRFQKLSLNLYLNLNFNQYLNLSQKFKLNQHMWSIALCYVFDPTFEVHCLKVINPNEKCARNKLES